MPRRPQLQSTFARAVVPVAGGIAFFAVLGLALWGVAAVISRNDRQPSDLLVSRQFVPGRVEHYAAIIAADGPIIFPDLLGTDADKTIVLQHDGSDPMHGWRLYLPHPNDRPASCKVTQVQHTRTFTDCGGRTLDVSALAPPPDGVGPAVSVDGVLTLDLVPDSATNGSTTTVAAPGTTGG